MSLTTPWSTAELFDLRFVQSNDVVYFFHPDHAPRKLVRLSASDFRLIEVDWNPDF